MKTLLDSAETWFFDSCLHNVDDTLRLLLSEGIQGTEPTSVTINEHTIDDLYPLQVTGQSRTAEVLFTDVAGFLIFDESYDQGDELFEEASEGVVTEAKTSRFRKFMAEHTRVESIPAEPLREFLVWTQDRVIQVLARAVDVRLSEIPPRSERHQGVFVKRPGR